MDEIIKFALCVCIGLFVSIMYDVIITKNRKRKKIKQLKQETLAVKPFVGNLKEGIIWYPSGWTYHMKTETWEAPNYNQDNKPLSFEEWKAQREKEQQK